MQQNKLGNKGTKKPARLSGSIELALLDHQVPTFDDALNELLEQAIDYTVNTSEDENAQADLFLSASEKEEAQIAETSNDYESAGDISASTRYRHEVDAMSIMSNEQRKHIKYQLDAESLKMISALCSIPYALREMKNFYSEVGNKNIMVSDIIISGPDADFYKDPNSRSPNATDRKKVRERSLHLANECESFAGALMSYYKNIKRGKRPSPKDTEQLRARKNKLVEKIFTLYPKHEHWREMIESIGSRQITVSTNRRGTSIFAAKHVQLQESIKAISGLRSDFAKGNLRLVMFITNLYKNRGISEGDLIQAGNGYMLHALEKWEPKRGEFATYASPWIKLGMSKECKSNQKTIRVPEHVLYTRSLVISYLRDNKLRDLFSLDIDAVAKCISRTPEAVMLSIVTMADTISTATPVGEDKDGHDASELGDMIRSPQMPLEKQVALKIDTERALSMVSEGEREILKRRAQGQTHESLRGLGGKIVSRERMRQRESQALETIRIRLSDDFRKLNRDPRAVKMSIADVTNG